MQKDMISRQILEEAIFAVADGYCKINLSRNIVPGNMYQLKRHIAMTEALSGMYDKMYYIELRENFIKSILSTDPV